MSVPFANVAALGVPVTVRTKFALAVAPPASVTVRVIVALPLCPAAGLIVAVRSAPLPANTILTLDTNAGFEDRPETTRLAAGVSASLTVKAMGGVGVLAGVVWSATALMLGGVLGAEVRIDRLQPPAIVPWSLGASSTTQSAHGPLGPVPLNAES